MGSGHPCRTSRSPLSANRLIQCPTLSNLLKAAETTVRAPAGIHYTVPPRDTDAEYMEAILKTSTDPIAGLLDRVIDVFDRELAGDVSFVNRLTEQVRAYRGKLLRPRLLLLAGRAC